MYNKWYMSCVYVDWLLAGYASILPTPSKYCILYGLLNNVSHLHRIWSAWWHYSMIMAGNSDGGL